MNCYYFELLKIQKILFKLLDFFKFLIFFFLSLFPHIYSFPPN